MSFESPGFTAHRATAPSRESLYAETRPPQNSRGYGYGSFERPRDTQLAGWFAKTLGVAILALSALFVLALLTWSVADPSWSNGVTGLKPKNALGPIGAVLSDIVIQSLGLASVFALLPPVFWAAQLLSRHGIDGARTKIVMAPFAVLCLAAFLSGLPKASMWPLGSGYGGLLGDFGAQFVLGLFGLVNAERAPLVTGVCLIIAGVSLLMLSLGLTPSDLKRMAERRGAHVPDSGWVSHLKAAVVTSASDEDVLAAGPAQSRTMQAPVEVFTAPPRTARAPSLPMPTAVQQIVEPTRVAPAPAASLGAVMQHPAPVAPRNAPVETIVPAHAEPAPHATSIQHVIPRPDPTHTPSPKVGYRRPAVTLLPQSSVPKADSRDLHIAEKLRARKLVEVLETYGVRSEVKDHTVGPVVTTFTIETAAGTRAARLISLTDDIARGLGVVGVRIQVSAARGTVAIEVPHDDPVSMGLRDFVTHDSYLNSGLTLPIVLGASALGEACVTDLADAAMLIAGQDTATRTALLNTAMTSLLYRHAPTALRFALLGSDAHSFESWSALPHLAAPAATGLTPCADQLAWAAAEIDARTLRMRAVSQSQSIDVYNERVRALGTSNATPLPYLVIVVADLADMIRDANPVTLAALDTILRRGKAAGVHLIAATSSAGDDALPPGLVAAFPVRVAAQVASKAESRALFGEPGAEDLPAGGDVLVHAGNDALRKALGGTAIHRLHAALLRTGEVRVIAMAAAKPGEISREPEPAARTSSPARALQQAVQAEWQSPASDSLYDRAVDVVRREQSAQASVLKRELSLTYGMAAELLDQMSRDGIVSAPDSDGHRRVLLSRAA
jgi:DNA segregation ATPase FtsK/SpoIIIE, S-DNA-T family